MTTKISPLAPESFPKMPEIEGVKMATAMCGIKYKNRRDVLLAEFAEGTNVAGVFTKSTTASANIVWGRLALKQHKARILVVNSGNANAFNGSAGQDSIDRVVGDCSKLFGCQAYEVFPSSTGVIGERLPDHLITTKLAELKGNLKSDIFEEAARAIMTTDTYPKGATRKCKIGGKEVKINGIVKGSGMIAPNMATMLAYIFTDANIENAALQKIFSEGADKSFNCITIDSDTSTSDTALIFATGKAGNSSSDNLDDFEEKLHSLLLELAHLVVKDGEGATKFISIKVRGAESEKAAKNVAMSIANSPLVKTAIAGEDANWGRIVMAAGKTEEKMNRERMLVEVGGTKIVYDGQLNPDYVENAVTKHMQGQNIDIVVDLGIGSGEAQAWTCDLTHEYITINADYRS